MNNLTIYLEEEQFQLSFQENSTIFVNKNFPITLFNMILFGTTNLTVFIVNLLVLFWLKIKDKNLVDRMVLLDCLTNMAVVIVLLLAFPTRVWHNTYVCYIISSFRCFVLTMKR